MIPANADFYNGVFRYVGTDGVRALRQPDAADRIAPGPQAPKDFLSLIPAAIQREQLQVGNSTSDRLLNTAGYRFNQTDLNNRDQYTFRGDYTATDAHRFEGVFSYFKETDDRTDLDFVSPDRPLVYHQLGSEAVCLRMALGGDVQVSERAAWRRQSRASAVSSRTGTTVAGTAL